MANAFDANNAPEGEPATVVVGDFIQWKRSDFIADYPSDLYTATYIARITGGGSSEIQLPMTGSATYYLATVSSSDSADFDPGFYHYQLEIVRNSDDERIVIDRGSFTALPDLDVNNADPRSHAAILLSKIETILSGKADADVSSYSIAGRSLTKMSFQELIEVRNFYKAEVSREKQLLDVSHGRKGHATVQVRF